MTGGIELAYVVLEYLRMLSCGEVSKLVLIMRRVVPGRATGVYAMHTRCLSLFTLSIYMYASTSI